MAEALVTAPTQFPTASTTQSHNCEWYAHEQQHSHDRISKKLTLAVVHKQFTPLSCTRAAASACP